MRRKPVILISLLLAAFVINLDTTIVNVALPTLVRDLHASNSQLQWVVDAFNLLFAASVLAMGSLSDRFGRKGMLLAGLSVFGLARLAGGLTDRRERALAIGLWGAITGVAIALGPIVGGWLLQAFDWRSIFFAMTPVAALAGVLVLGFVPTSRDPKAPPLDRAVFLLSTATVGLLVYTIIEAPGRGWASTWTLAAFALAAALPPGLVVPERRG